MIVVITDEAEADLERIGDHIALDSALRAHSFVQQLRERCMHLEQTPLGFPLVPRHENSGVHRRVHGNYLIFYRVGTESIDVLHFLHGATDYESVLFPEKTSGG